MNALGGQEELKTIDIQYMTAHQFFDRAVPAYEWQTAHQFFDQAHHAQGHEQNQQFLQGSPGKTFATCLIITVPSKDGCVL